MITYPGVPELAVAAAAVVVPGLFTDDKDCLFELFRTDFMRATYLLSPFFFSSGAIGPVVAAALMVI